MMFRALLPSICVLALSSAALAQIPPPSMDAERAPIQPKRQPSGGLIPIPTAGDTVHIKSHIASFKIVPNGPELPSGRLEFSFAGTVMVSGLVPGSTLQTTGAVQKEYENKEHGRQVFFGRGKILLVGKFKGCQWFGKDLDLTFKGAGIFRVVSEFDKNLDIGTFTFEGAQTSSLQPNLITIMVPRVTLGAVRAIKREDFEKQKVQKGGH